VTDLVWELYDGFDPAERPDPPVPVEDRDLEEIEEEVQDTSLYAEYPRCRTCKDPNLSLNSDRCISCRIALPTKTISKASSRRTGRR
jgi:hypothetical protein